MGRAKRFVIGVSWVVLSASGCAAPQFHYVDQPKTVVARDEDTEPAPVEVLSVHDEFRLESDGTYTRTLHQRYRVLVSEAVSGWGVSTAPWSPWYMDRPDIQATVTSPGG